MLFIIDFEGVCFAASELHRYGYLTIAQSVNITNLNFRTYGNYLLFLGILCFLVLFAISVYNRLVRLRNNREQSFADIDVQLEAAARSDPAAC
jgi:hypothetical protein